MQASTIFLLCALVCGAFATSSPYAVPVDCLNGNASPWTCCLSNEGARLAFLADCSTYVQCYYGRVMLMACPSGMHWGVAQQECVFPAEAKCQSTCARQAPKTNFLTMRPKA